VLDGEAARVRSLGSTTACSAGCSFCCHVHVEVTRAEVLAIVAFVEALDAGDRAPLRERIEARVAEAASMTHEERWARRIPCALLASDGTCAVYAARPLRCRAFHSADRARCERSFEGGSEEAPATIPALDRVHDAVEEGFERALDARGLVEPPLLLEPALLAALSR
jgi:Fe-S-cluster containining protein